MAEVTSTTTGHDADGRLSGTRQSVVIFMISLAGLLLEVGYTRIISYKLWYYYTYLVLGLALLGIGTGGVIVALSGRVRELSTETVVRWCGLSAAVTIPLGYLAVARIPIDTVAIWDYGTRASLRNIVALAAIAFVLFASFIALGVMISVLLGRAGTRVGRLYFADLIGAGLGCMAAIPLITRFGPPAVIMIAAAVFAATAALVGTGPVRAPSIAGGLACVALLAVGLTDTGLPDIRLEGTKGESSATTEFSEWGPVFRVDVVDAGDPDSRFLAHDGSFGSGIHRFDGDAAALTRYRTESRAVPFAMLGTPSENTLIIGSAGGNEILAALHFGSRKITGVELNPVTVGLLTDEYADFTGHLADIPNVTIENADGRSFLARSSDDYDLVWYVAPDSYAANNAASSGAFVLSESYLYTVEMIVTTLERLTDDGIMVVQFGEIDFDNRPNRTQRYVMTAREALGRLGVADPSAHMMVASDSDAGFGGGSLSTIVLKRSPIKAAEVERISDLLPSLPTTAIQWAPGLEPAETSVGELASAASNAAATQLAERIDRRLEPVTDDSPFFWHFVGFGDVLSDMGRVIRADDPEDSLGERVLLLLLAISVAYAALFLLAPFIRRGRDRKRPARGALSVAYFAALGLGFMLLEIVMIQRLTLMLGYPTYSLTVTLAAILVFTGVGALVSGRIGAIPRAPAAIFAVLASLVLLYSWKLVDVSEALLGSSLGVRIVAAVAILAPLGLCLGTFMPLGLTEVARLNDEAERPVAFAWAVNGFFSVIGSVLTTILSMTFGFGTVMFCALALYAAAAAMLTSLRAAPG